MKTKTAILLFLSSHLFGCTSLNKRAPQSEDSVQLQQLEYQTHTPFVNDISFRTLIYFEEPQADFKGCVMYLEGLGDSILNHEPLFNSLSKSGYRVLSFDYMGQGGSSGSMNHTRIRDAIFTHLQIGEQAKFVWEALSKKTGINGKDCRQSEKRVIGWSTGGLAAYSLAQEKWARAVVLIAPGISPKIFVGESFEDNSRLLTGEQIITERTLTRNLFKMQRNPHRDPVKPTSPTQVPLFSKNLILTALESQIWQIENDIRGLVFLSGDSDTYVNKDKTEKILSLHAAHFSVVTYADALHEIDNESEQITKEMYSKINQFFQE